MATYYSNDFRAGLKIMLDGEPYAVADRYSRRKNLQIY